MFTLWASGFTPFKIEAILHHFSYDRDSDSGILRHATMSMILLGDIQK
eukprot:gene6113-2699_t